MININKLIGMPVKEARTLCEEVGVRLRITKQDQQAFVGTCEYDTDRVNVRVENGKVAKVEGMG